ncbi:MAG: hypothetical protein CM15mP80_11100 [Alphaproteobacteria bacterium]|nr:MAG: hypothetical protein CM15mP80_11100 [Alphaproteobacteria bacterium]
MTGGTVVILGPTGENFGAGMTGGMAFIYDPENVFLANVNPETLEIRRVKRRPLAKAASRICNAACP